MAESDADAQIAAIQAELLGRCSDLGALIGETVWNEVPFYQESGVYTRSEVLEACTLDLGFPLAGLNDEAGFDTTAAANSGREGAHDGVPLPETHRGPHGAVTEPVAGAG